MSTVAVLPAGKDTIDVPNAQLDDLQFEASTGGLIHTDTADTSDTKAMIIAGGGAAGATRGATLGLYGNEHATNPGAALLDTGGNGRMILRTQGTGNLEMCTNNTLRIYLNSNTDELLPRATSAISIGSTSLVFNNVYSNNYYTTGVDLKIGPTSNHGINFTTNGSNKWSLSNAGSINPSAVDTYRIGDTNRVLSLDVASIRKCDDISVTGGNLTIGPTTAQSVIIRTNNVNRWEFKGDSTFGGGSALTNSGYWFQFNASNDDNLLALNTTLSRPTLAFLRSGSSKATIFTDGGGAVTGTADALVCRTGGSGGVFMAPTATGWSAVSDVRRKKNIKKFNVKYTDLMSIDTIKFAYNDDSVDTKERVGFSAQNLLTVWPDAVNVGNDVDKTLSIQFDLLIPYIIATMKDMVKDIQKNTKKAKQLETRIEQLLNTNIPDDA